jgi:hypothetical protein
MYSKKWDTGAILDTNRKVGLEEFLHVSRSSCQNAGQNHNTEIAGIHFKNQPKYKYVVTKKNSFMTNLRAN